MALDKEYKEGTTRKCDRCKRGQKESERGEVAMNEDHINLQNKVGKKKGNNPFRPAKLTQTKCIN